MEKECSRNTYVNLILIKHVGNLPKHSLTSVVLDDLVLNVYLVTVSLTNGE